MGMPVAAKTFQFNVNNVLAPGANLEACVDAMLIKIVQALTGFGTNPWVCKGSTTSLAGSLDGVNRWTTIANLVHHASVYSWIVLEQTGLGGAHPQICIALTNTTVTRGTIVVSPAAGFTGGGVGSRPTALDEQVIVNNADMINAATGTFQCVVHAEQSTDGQCTRVMVHINNICVLFWAFEQLKDTHANFLQPWTFTIANGATESPVIANLYTVATKTWFRHGSANYGAYWSCEGAGGSPLPTLLNAVANEISTNWPMMMIGFVCNTAGARGKHGHYQDMYWASSFNSEGTCFPADASRTWIQVGDIVMPWNGTNPVIA